MSTETFGQALRRLRGDLPVRELANRAKCAKSYISTLEHGRGHPGTAIAAALDAALKAGGVLISLAAEADDSRGRVRKTVSSAEDDMERRRLMQDAAAVAAVGAVAPVLTALTHAWQESTPRISGASVSQEMIDDWEQAADLHAKAARLQSPASVLGLLAVEFAAMAPHLARTQPAAVRRDLTHAAARHAALIAGKWTDLGNRREARRWWNKTRTLVDESGDRLLASWLRSHESLHRAHDPLDGPAEALLVAQEACRLAGQQPSAPLTVATAEEAMMLAILGQHTEAVTTLRAADDVFVQLPSSNGRFRSAERELRFHHSAIYSLVGDERRAGEAHDYAERSYPPGDQALPRIRLHRATLHAVTDPVEAVNEALRVVGEIPAERWLTRYTADTRRVLAALPENARDLPAAQELRALIA